MSVETTIEKRQVSSTRFSRRRFFTGTALSAAALALYSTELERHYIEIVPQTFAIAKLPEAFHGFRIAQLSDIHLEQYTEDFFLRRAVDHINALAPDMVLLTGDYISNNEHGPDTRAYAAMPHCAAILGELKCPLRYAILGNHDVQVDAAFILDHLTRHGITPLVNQAVPIERNGERIWLGGLDDCAMGSPDLNGAIPEKPDAPVLLMAHEPDYIESILKHSRGHLVDLVFSGHSHGGQIQLPFYGPVRLPPMGWKYYEGRFRFNNTQLYVNRGIGTVELPIRFNCPPEITNITLQPA